MSKTSSGIRSATRANRERLKRDGDGNAVHNLILLGLPRKERDAVLSKLTLVKLNSRDILQEVGEEIKFGYFPNTAMASVLNIMSDGKSVEVGLTGKEGFIGLPLVAGFRTSVTRINTQAEGTAFRVEAKAFLAVLSRCPQLNLALFRCSQEAIMQVTQIAACNRLHEVDERLARWLLMCQDRIESDLLPLTQEFLSQMLGTRVASVSVAAAVLQRAGLIRYSRGRVTVLKRAGLEEAACECYQVMQNHLESWERESRATMR